MRFLRRLVVDEEGSAILEFVALALPLFIPLFIYLNLYAHSSDSQSSMRTLGREMARAFVTSENDAVAEKVAAEVFVKGSEVLGYRNGVESGEITYRIECEQTPCISPRNQIRISLLDKKVGIEVTAVEYVSPWA
jgi:hypothetical protein